MAVQQILAIGFGDDMRRMMQGDDLQPGAIARAHLRANALDGRGGQRAILVAAWRGRVGADDAHPGGLPHRFEVGSEHALKTRIGPEHARPHIEQRDVMVAGDGDDGEGQARANRQCRIELGAPCALGDIARQQHALRANGLDQTLQRFGHGRVLRAEVRIRLLHQHAHLGPEGIVDVVGVTERRVQSSVRTFSSCTRWNTASPVRKRCSAPSCRQHAACRASLVRSP